IQNYERRYTWLLSIHVNESGLRTAQIASFFRRQLGEAEESYDVLDINDTDQARRQVRLPIPAGANPKAGDYIFGTWRQAHPRISGFVCRHGRWYRVVGVTTDRPNDRLTLTLDRPWVGERSSRYHPKVVFPREIVGVFDLN